MHAIFCGRSVARRRWCRRRSAEVLRFAQDDKGTAVFNPQCAISRLRFQTDVADAADEVVGGAFAVGHGDYFDGRRLVVGAENELASGDFDVSYRASIAFQNSVHIEFAFAIGLECVVMAVYQERCSGQEAGIHAGGFPGIELDEHEAVPAGAVAVGFGFQLVQEGFLELEDIFDVHGGDERLGGGGGGVGEQNVFKFVAAGRQDGGALVDLGGIEQIEHGEVLRGEDFVHAFEAEAALAVEEVGDVGLLESGLLGEVEAGEFACFDALPEQLAKVILQDFELHGPEYSTGL